MENGFISWVQEPIIEDHEPQDEVHEYKKVEKRISKGEESLAISALKLYPCHPTLGFLSIL